MHTLFRPVASLLLAVALADPAAAAPIEPRGKKPGRTERASTCDLAALSETIELHRRAEPMAARAQLEAIRIAVGRCTGFVLALAHADEIRRFCAAPETYSAAHMARELRRRIAALDADEVLRSSSAGQSCQAAYKHELKTTRVVLRPGRKPATTRNGDASE